MKKMIVLVCLFTIMLLSGCESRDLVTMIVPYGSTTLAQTHMMENKERYQVDVVMGADALVTAFAAKSHDVIFAPTQLGLVFYDDDEDYRLLATVVWGNLYLVSITTQLDSFAALDGQDITVFSQNQTPDIIMRHLMIETEVDMKLSYVDSVSSAIALLKTNPSMIVMAAEPMLSVLAETEPELEVIDLQAVYKDVTGRDSYPQASVFVRPDLPQATINMILGDLESSLARTNSAPFESAQIACELGMTIQVETLAQAIPRSHLRFVTALDAKEDILAYFDMITMYQPEMLSGKVADDMFFQGGL